MMETPHQPLKIGAGIYDITGPAAEAGMFGYAKAGQLTSGIHMRLRSRAFAFYDGRQKTHFVFASVDVGQMTESVTQEVIKTLENHPRIPPGTYSRDNVMLSAVHTHCAPGGLSHFLIYSLHPPLKGFDTQNFDCVVTGIVESILRAYLNLQPAIIREARGDCMNASVNRSIEAYNANPEEERAEYQYDTDKEMVLWRFDGTDGFPIGMINWFAVHPTSMGNWYTLITGDNKGFASHIFEREHGNNHLMDKPRSFVAAFAQTNEGDVSPNIHGPRAAVSETGDYDRMLVVSNAQLDTARRLYEEAASSPPNTGPIRFKHQYVDYANIELSPDWHEFKECPPSTCPGCIGVSMLSGTQYDGRGIQILQEGMKWKDYGLVTLCPNLQQQQKEKLVCFPTNQWGLSPSVLPLQLVTIGDTALAAIPFEATTMAGRRLRSSISESLAGINVTSTIIAGLSNAYCGYMTTREEYSVQRYEGASTHFGPNQLSATKQQFHQLATALMAEAAPSTLAPPTARFGKAHWRTPVVHDGVPEEASFGDVVEGCDVKSKYKVGQAVSVQFHAGHPKNNLRVQRTFLEVHRFVQNIWIMHANDGDENTLYEWRRTGMDGSIATITWNIPTNTPSGIYRIKHIGDYKTAWRKSVTEYSGYSSQFEIVY